MIHFKKALAIVSATLCLNLSAYSQTVTLNVNNVTVKEAMEQLKKTSGYAFVFSSNDVNTKSRVSISVKNASLDEVINQILKGQSGLAYDIQGNNIVVKKQSSQQVKDGVKKTVKGKVVDAKGEPVIGATVMEKGTPNGTITDFDGNFSLVMTTDAPLEISYIGFTSQQLKPQVGKLMSVTLKENTETLDEVVVVGYGTQKKVNLTGAVGQVDSKVMESRPITSTGSALQGAIPNLQVTMNSGQPGSSASLNVRGTTSINGGSPLVLVDGVEMSLDLVNPNDIANVTVLKDAAASAIYGVRAAFGVILVTTKNAGKAERVTVNYSGNVSFAKPSIMPEFIESQSEFAEWMNQACVNGKVASPYTAETIAKMKAYEQDPDNNPEYEYLNGRLYYYGYSDAKKQMVKNVAPTQRHNLSISGGNEKTRFYSSIGYLNQKGLYKVGGDSYQQLNTRLSVENQTTKWMKLGFKALYTYSTQDTPYTYDSKDVWKRVVYTLPTDFIQAWKKDSRYPELDGFDGMYAENNAYTLLNEGGRNKYNKHDVWTTASADFDIMKGWKAHVDFNYNMNYKKSSEHSKPIKFFDIQFNETYGRTATNYYKLTDNNKNYYSFNAYTDYENTFGKHYVKLMLGYNQELTKYSDFSGQRYDVFSSDLPTLSLASGNHQVSEDGYEWALRGAFFRLNYIYADRYLLEVNGRYDGTSRFPKDNRFVFLPSVSAAWRISEESFMKSTRGWLDNLKLRASYGVLGNQMISASGWSGNTKYYPYIPFMSNNTSKYWLFGDEYATIINPGNLVSSSLTWEKVKTINVGLDASVLNQRLNLSFDYYVRTTSDMLIKATYPEVLGTTAPPENSAELKTRGWELSLNWKDRVGKDFGYELGFILSDSQAEVTKYTNPSGSINTYYEGMKIGDIWGYETEGLFQSDDEAKSWYSQTEIKNVQWGAGDVKFKNQNGDNVIDDGNQTLDSHGDMVVIGNTTPRYQYSFTANLTYKDYYLNIFMQGVGKRDFWPGDEAFWPAATQYYNAQKWFVSDSWTPENPNAYFPITRATDNRNRKVKTDRYLQNAAYLRCKNITLGWNLPKTWIAKVGLSNASVYVSGENLFEFTSIKGAYDPEAASGGGKMVYPFMRTYSLGVNLTF